MAIYAIPLAYNITDYEYMHYIQCMRKIIMYPLPGKVVHG